MLYKRAFSIVAVILCASIIYSEDITDVKNLDDYIDTLIQSAEAGQGLEKRNFLIMAAEFKKVSGDTAGAADLYEQASLAVPGQKDFDSLYKASVLYVEMADYRKAQTINRIIAAFSEDSTLRIKTAVLNSRILNLNGNTEDSFEIIKELFASLTEYPDELLYWFDEFRTLNSDLVDLSEIEPVISDKRLYTETEKILIPESIFGIGDNSIAETVSAEEPETNDVNPVYIQLGSFTVKDNAYVLLESVKSKGFQARLETKTVNGTDYISVIVPVEKSSEMQTLYIRLKEAGYEGYPVY